MCGIAVRVEPDDNQNLLPVAGLDALTTGIKYRGKDAEGSRLFNHGGFKYAFLHSLLSINQPLAHAEAQPLLCQITADVLTFNGEVYNYKELSDKHLDQKIYAVATDTAVILGLLQTLGINAVKLFDGMFALAYFHAGSNITTLAVDRFGIKPLYYSVSGRSLTGASSAIAIANYLKEITNSGFVTNVTALNNYVSNKYFGSEPLNGIQLLRPGHILKFSNGKAEVTQSTTPLTASTLKLDIVGLGNVVDALDKALSVSVARQSVAAHKVGIMLSGGVDSSLLAALAIAQSIPLTAYTICFGNETILPPSASEDALAAEKVAKQLSIPLTQVKATPQLLHTYLTDINIIPVLDFPIIDSAGFLTWLITRKAAEDNCKVLLNGCGADEIFGGYNRHAAYFQYLKLRKVLPLHLASKLPSTTGTSPLFRSIQHIKKFGSAVDKTDPKTTFLNFCKLFNDADSLLKQSVSTSKTQTISATEDASVDALLGWALNHDLTQYLVHDALAVADQNGLLNQVEIRVPFLSQQVVDIANSLPASALFAPTGKWLLHALLRRYDLDWVIKRSKNGFGAPLIQWLALPLFDSLLNDVINADCLNAVFKPGALASILHKAKQGEPVFAQLAFGLLMLHQWLKHHKHTIALAPHSLNTHVDAID